MPSSRILGIFEHIAKWSPSSVLGCIKHLNRPKNSNRTIEGIGWFSDGCKEHDLWDVVLVFCPQGGGSQAGLLDEHRTTFRQDALARLKKTIPLLSARASVRMRDSLLAVEISQLRDDALASDFPPKVFFRSHPTVEAEPT